MLRTLRLRLTAREIKITGLVLCLAIVGWSDDVFPGTMVVAANVSGNWDLFLLRSGQRPQQLTASPMDERSPAISPDGSRISYITSDGAIWLMDMKSKIVRKLGDKFNGGHYGYPAWMPDGKTLIYSVYTFNPPSEDADIHTYQLDDAKGKMLIGQTGPQDYAAVSPDGRHVAYMSSLATLIPGHGATITQQLWVVSLQTGKPRQMFYGSSRDTRPAWSPDGRQIAFSSDRSGTVEIWLADAEGKSEPFQLTSGGSSKSSPAWSPDGKEIVYVTTASGRSELAISNVATKTARTIRPFDGKQTEILSPAWR